MLSRSALTGSLLAALALSGCPAQAPPPANADPVAQALYVKAACVTCHGNDGRGFAGLGPDIVGKAKHWTRQTLVEYFDDPAAFKKKSSRLGYTGKEMPAIASSITPEERARIADHALWLMRQ